jgi:hypothetical protein
MRACGLCSRGTAAARADLLALPSQAEFLAPDAKAAIYGWEPVRYWGFGCADFDEANGLMPYGSRQPGRPTLHVGRPFRRSAAWVQMEHRHRASIHRERTPRRYTRDLSRVLGLRECQEFG